MFVLAAIRCLFSSVTGGGSRLPPRSHRDLQPRSDTFFSRRDAL